MCMYVYSCKSGKMYKINFYLSCDYLLHEKCMGNPVHLCIWQKKKCLTKSDQMFIPTRQYSISGHDFCGLNFVRECAFNPRVLIKKKKKNHFQHKHSQNFTNLKIPLETLQPVFLQAQHHSWFEFWGLQPVLMQSA